MVTEAPPKPVLPRTLEDVLVDAIEQSIDRETARVVEQRERESAYLKEGLRLAGIPHPDAMITALPFVYDDRNFVIRRLGGGALCVEVQCPECKDWLRAGVFRPDPDDRHSLGEALRETPTCGVCYPEEEPLDVRLRDILKEVVEDVVADMVAEFALL